MCRLENIPQISDADMLMTILEHLGAKIRMVNRNTVEIDCTDVRYTDAPYDLMRRIRASYYLIGAMLGRFGAAKTTMPGGCNFGVRPIDQHIKGMTALGADVEVTGGFVYAKALDGKLHGTRIYLSLIHIYLALGLHRGKMHLDPDEFLNVEKYKLSELENLVMSGEIDDAKTIIAVLKARRYLEDRK